MRSREELVKRALAEFLTTHCAHESISCIDDIVLSYMVSILEGLGSAAGHGNPLSDIDADDQFDVDQFTEMMDAYLPGFQQFNTIEVSEWMFELSAKLEALASSGNLSTEADSDSIDCIKTNSIDVFDTNSHPSKALVPNRLIDITSDQQCTAKCVQHPALGVKECGETRLSKSTPSERDWPSLCRTEDVPIYRLNGSSTGASNESLGACSNLHSCDGSSQSSSEAISMLQEMFPSSSSVELLNCLSLAHGDLDTAAQLVLDRESRLQVDGRRNKTRAKESSVNRSRDFSANQTTTTDFLSNRLSATSIISDDDPSSSDHLVKKTIVAKYSYVDMDDDKRQHRPTITKSEPKKLIRYLDGRVVSVKGERFTEIKKTESEEEKKTYINLKPAKQYRFH